MPGEQQTDKPVIKSSENAEKHTAHKPAEKPKQPLGQREAEMAQTLGAGEATDSDNSFRKILGLKPEASGSQNNQAEKKSTNDATKEVADRAQAAESEIGKQSVSPEATKNLTPEELKRKTILENLPPEDRKKFEQLSASIRSLEMPRRGNLKRNMSNEELSQYHTDESRHEMYMNKMNKAISEIRLYGDNNPLIELAMEDLSNTICGNLDPYSIGKKYNNPDRIANFTRDEEKSLLQDIVKSNVKDVFEGIKIDGYKKWPNNPAKILFNLEDNLKSGYSLVDKDSALVSGDAGNHFNKMYSSLVAEPGLGKRLKDMFSSATKRREQEEYKTDDILRQKQLLEGALFHSLVNSDTKPLKGKLFQTEGEAEFKTRPYQIASALARFSGEKSWSMDKNNKFNEYNKIVEKGLGFRQEKSVKDK
jgi:hypothetical protein